MRKPRLKAPQNYEHAFYHCISRIVHRQFLLGDDEKEQFLKYMRECARFCGLQIITYCIMSNQFHILVQVPRRSTTPFSDEELLTRLEALSWLTNAATLRQRLETFRAQGHDAAAEKIRQGIRSEEHTSELQSHSFISYAVFC